LNNGKLRIGFTYNARAEYPVLPDTAPDRYAEFDTEQTLKDIENALSTDGHEVVRIGNAKNLLNKIQAGETWDIVFNIAEGLSGRNREAQVPAILEVFDIPYTGSDALTMSVTLDKAVAKTIIAHHGLSTPRFHKVTTPKDLEWFALNFPVIVKPGGEGTSKGITDEAVVRDRGTMEKRAAWVMETYRQPALVEEFIVGQEFTVAVVGNETPVVLPPVQLSLGGKINLGYDLYTSARTEHARSEIRYLCPSPAPLPLRQKIETLALGCYRVLGCRDIARIDIRVDARGTPYFLECNPLPHLGSDSAFPLIARAAGTTYEKLLCRILEHGCSRHGLLSRQLSA
jgi:D-alanine-D-alanine ligase